MTERALAGPALLRTLNRGGRALEQTGIPLVRLDDRRLIADAQARTGLREFGDDAFREPLARLVDSLRQEANLSLIGRIAARQDIVRLLSNRLLMEADRRRHPEIDATEVRAPIFVTGLPRTGTTLLHGLLAQDPTNRAPLTWEMMYPSPPLRRRPLPGRDRRIHLAQQQIRWFRRLSPDFGVIHPIGAQLPEECLVITSHSFLSFQFQTMYEVPSYQTWLERQNLRPAYEGHRRFLQYLQWRHPAHRWVLKAPAHLFGLQALVETYPDAGIVLTHRAPLDVVASLASLTTVLRSTFREDTDPREVGPEMTRRWAEGLERALSVRGQGRISSRRVVDVLYPDLVRDPIGTVEEIYRQFDLHLTPHAVDRMKRFLARNPKDKLGRHRYSLEEFGLDPTEEKARYGEYARRFGL